MKGCFNEILKKILQCDLIRSGQFLWWFRLSVNMASKDEGSILDQIRKKQICSIFFLIIFSFFLNPIFCVHCRVLLYFSSEFLYLSLWKIEILYHNHPNIFGRHSVQPWRPSWRYPRRQSLLTYSDLIALHCKAKLDPMTKVNNNNNTKTG